MPAAKTAAKSRNGESNHDYQTMEANDIIRNHALIASGAGFIPIMGIDVAAVTAVQARMVYQLAGLYEVEIPQSQVKNIATLLATNVISRVISATVRKVFNSFAAFGRFAEGMTNAAVAGFFTAAVGEIYKNHFASGGNMEDLSLKQLYEYFQEQIQEGSLHPSSFVGMQGAFRFLTK